MALAGMHRRLIIHVLISLCTSMLLTLSTLLVFDFWDLPVIGLFSLLLFLGLFVPFWFVVSLVLIEAVSKTGMKKSSQAFIISLSIAITLTTLTFLLKRNAPALGFTVALTSYRGFPFGYYGSSLTGSPGGVLFGVYFSYFFLDVLIWFVLAFMLVLALFHFQRKFPAVVITSSVASIAITLISFAYLQQRLGTLWYAYTPTHGFPWGFYQQSFSPGGYTGVLWYGLSSDILFWFFVSYPIVVGLALLIEKFLVRGRANTGPMDARV